MMTVVALTMFREAMKEQGRRSDLGDNVTEVPQAKGNSKAYTLSRLEREMIHIWGFPYVLRAVQSASVSRCRRHGRIRRWDGAVIEARIRISKLTMST